MTGDLFQGGLLEAPVPSQTRCFEGGHPVFQGSQAPQAPVIRPLHDYCLIKSKITFIWQIFF